jgi:hydroxyacylglutathione hydrolase
MPVVARRVGNNYNHISYLVFCAETREATAIDPFHLELTMETARHHGLSITQIVNTHEHWDHAGRNEQFRAVTGAKVLAPKAAAGVIEKVDRMLVEGDLVQVGSSLPLTVLETPGHTMTHISLRGEEVSEPFLLCGDTIFGAGVGNCGYGGHVGTLFETIVRLARELPPTTRLYPGHDYLGRNLEFTLSLMPDNNAAAELLDQTQRGTIFTTLADERTFNLFLLLGDQSLRHRLIDQGLINTTAEDEDVFRALRKLRDSW